MWIVGLVLVFLMFIYFGEIIAVFKSKKYDSQVLGQVESYEAQESLYQSIEGSEVVEEHFTITYSYRIGDVDYRNTELLVLKGRDKRKFFEILDNPEQAVTIRFDSENPNMSMLDLYD